MNDVMSNVMDDVIDIDSIMKDVIDGTMDDVIDGMDYVLCIVINFQDGVIYDVVMDVILIFVINFVFISYEFTIIDC